MKIIHCSILEEVISLGWYGKRKLELVFACMKRWEECQRIADVG